MVKQNTHQSFIFEPSRIALGFQFLCLTIILVIIFQILNIWLWFIFLITALISLKYFRQNSSIYKLEQLDYEHWSVQYLQKNMLAKSAIQQVKIGKLIDHIFYISICFDDKKIKPLIIWQDQLPKDQWKSLKVRAKLG